MDQGDIVNIEIVDVTNEGQNSEQNEENMDINMESINKQKDQNTSDKGKRLSSSKSVSGKELKKPNSKVNSNLSDVNNGPKDNNERKNKKVVIEKEPVKVIKRAPPKSKWGNIMSEINDNQKTPKPKMEVKSKLASYLNTPTPVKKETEKKEKPKKKLPSAPKVDYSKVQSKLSIPPQTPKRSTSPSEHRKSAVTAVKESDIRRHSSVTSCPSSPVPPISLNDSFASTDIDSVLLSARSMGSTGNLNESNTSKDLKHSMSSHNKPSSKYP